jgi:hypothetical protein
LIRVQSLAGAGVADQADREPAPTQAPVARVAMTTELTAVFAVWSKSSSAWCGETHSVAHSAHAPAFVAVVALGQQRLGQESGIAELFTLIATR